MYRERKSTLRLMYDLERKYYVYVLMDPRVPGPFVYGSQSFEYLPFYIGKGTGYRMTAHFTEAKRVMGELAARVPSLADPLVPPSGVLFNAKEEQKLVRIIDIMKSTGGKPVAKKIKTGINEFESFELEASMIALIGRRQKGMGPLTNENDGEQFVGARPIKLKTFGGMNNVRAEGEPSVYTQHGRKECSPRVILNADVTAGGRILKRTGRRLFVPLPGAHSLWSNHHCMLAVADGKLYRINGTTPVEIATISDPDARVYFVEVEGKVYFANENCHGIFNPATNQVEDWGTEVPPTPVGVATSGSGGLEEGMYAIAYTYANSDGLHGLSSEIALVPVLSEGTITLSNRPESAHVWISDPDSDKLYYLGGEDTISATYVGGDVLQTIGYMPIPNMTCLARAYGRTWGVDGKLLRYSDPYRSDLFSPESYLEFDEEPVMVAPVYFGGEAGTANSTTGGLYVGFETHTLFLAGADPKLMAQRQVGPGVVKGTLAYCNNVPQLGNNVPIWVAKDGIVAGTTGGTVVNMTSDKVKFNPGNMGASLGRTNNGEFQFLSNFKRGDNGEVGFGDEVTTEVIRNGKVI